MNAPGLHQAAAASLQHTLSPRLQRAVRLLQMSSQDFAQVVRDALDSNPFLEPEDPPPGADAAADEDDTGPLPSHAEAWGIDGVTRMHQAGPDGAFFDTIAAPTSLASHLLGQLMVLPVSERDLALAAAVVASLDDDGYLRTPLEEIAQAVPVAPAAAPGDMLVALRRVQALDPSGVAARGVAECLQLQLPSIPAEPVRELAGVILRNHLGALASRDMRLLARRIGQPQDRVEAACAAIRRLDPHPGWRFAPPSVQFVTPDVIVRKVRGRWTTTLNEAVVPRVKLNRTYVDLFRQHRDPRHAELGTHLQDARWTVRNVEQRFSTILAIAQAIVKRQQHFLAYGAMAMKPLALREIAEEVGVHESTVSRVTNNKFLATPCGVFELKYFFSRGLATTSGRECSPTAIRGLIQELIAGEPTREPLSDVEIARQLGVQGLQVARRTVTKYRQLLKIAPAPRRRASGTLPAERTEAPLAPPTASNGLSTAVPGF